MPACKVFLDSLLFIFRCWIFSLTYSILNEYKFFVENIVKYLCFESNRFFLSAQD